MVPATRRQFLRAGAVGLASVAGCLDDTRGSSCSTGRGVHRSDVDLPRAAAWPTYQADPGNSGYAPDATGPTGDDVGVAWRYSACTEAESGVVVHGGRAYAGGLVVDGRTGESRGGEWHGHMTTPAVTDEALYVGASDLEARNPRSGELRWTFGTDGDAGALPAPTVVDGTVYVPGGIGDATLYAVAESTEQWRYETEADVEAPVAVEDGLVVAVDESGTVYALDAATGDERWTRTVEHGDPRNPPVLVDGRLYWGSDERILAMGATDGATVWERTDGPGGVAAVADGTVFVASGTTVAALGAADGTVQWEVSSPVESPSPLAVAGGAVHVADASRPGPAPVVALDAADGSERWRIETRTVSFGDYTRAGVTAPMAVVDGAVYVATIAGDLYAIADRQQSSTSG